MPGTVAKAQLLRCDKSPANRASSTLPRASARYQDGTVLLRLAGYGVASCSQGVPPLRLVRRGKTLELSSYHRRSAGPVTACMSRCEVQISAPLKLDKGTYQLRYRRGGDLVWLLDAVPSQTLVAN